MQHFYSYTGVIKEKNKQSRLFTSLKKVECDFEPATLKSLCEALRFPEKLGPHAEIRITAHIL